MDLQRHFWKFVLGAAVLAGVAYDVWTPLGYQGFASAGLNALAAAVLGRATHIAYAFTDVVMLALVVRILVAPGKRTASFLLVPRTSGTKAVLEVSDTGARAIVDAHEGTIGVVSSEGAETISRIELPLARDTRTNRPSEVAA
jgi:hypothetical protein